MIAHTLNHHLVTKFVVHGSTYLADTLLAILLEFFARANLRNHIFDTRLYLGRDFRFGHFNTVNGSLMQEQLLDCKFLGDGTIGVTLPAYAFDGRLDARHLNVTLEDCFVANHPYHLVNHIGTS